MSNLKQRVEKLEKAQVTGGSVEAVEAWLLQNYGPEVREMMRGHEAELTGRISANGNLTFEALQVLYNHLPEEMKTQR